MDFAPGEGTFAAGDGAGVVEQGQGAALGPGVQAAELAEVQRQGLAVQDRGDDPGATGQASGFGGGDRDSAVQDRDSQLGEVVQKGVVVDLDDDLGVVAGGAGPALGGEVLDELAQGGTVGFVDVGAVAGAGRGLVD